MSTRLKIKIDREVLQRSKNCLVNKLSKNCAIAEAIREVFPFAQVSKTYIYFWPDSAYDKDYNFYNNELGSSLLPEEARYLIDLFDKSTPEEREKLPETEFEIEIPDSVIEQVKIQGDIEEIFAKSRTMSLV